MRYMNVLMILQAAANLGNCTNRQISEHSGIRMRYVQRLSEHLADLGLLENISQTAHKHWRYTPPMPVFKVDGVKLNPQQLVKFLEKYHGLDIRLE